MFRSEIGLLNICETKNKEQSMVRIENDVLLKKIEIENINKIKKINKEPNNPIILINNSFLSNFASISSLKNTEKIIEMKLNNKIFNPQKAKNFILQNNEHFFESELNVITNSNINDDCVTPNYDYTNQILSTTKMKTSLHTNEEKKREIIFEKNEQQLNRSSNAKKNHNDLEQTILFANPKRLANEIENNDSSLLNESVGGEKNVSKGFKIFNAIQSKLRLSAKLAANKISQK